jgi:dephospho-CoA kinase
MKRKMMIIGLTGSIGMGKSTGAKMLKKRGLPVYNADQAVHAALKKNGAAVGKIAKLFPETLQKGAIDKKKLAAIVFADPKALRQIEKILHPLAEKAEKAFLAEARREGKKAVLLEIPLLFETGAEKRCDVTICLTAAAKIQKARVLARPAMTEARFKAIRKRQMSESEKKKRATFIVNTGKNLADTERQLYQIWNKIQEMNNA